MSNLPNEIVTMDSKTLASRESKGQTMLVFTKYGSCGGTHHPRPEGTLRIEEKCLEILTNFNRVIFERPTAPLPIRD